VISEHLRSNVVGYVALFIALAIAPAWAASKIGPGEISKNAVRSKHVKDGQIKGQDVGANAIDASKVPSDALTGADIRESTLQLSGIPSGPPSGPASGDLSGSYPSPQIGAGAVGSPEVSNNSISFVDIADGGINSFDLGDNVVNSAKVADNSLTGADIDESTLSFGCQTGRVLGFARVKGLNSIPSTYTSSSAYVDFASNCTGDAVQVRSDSSLPVGHYYVRFVNNPAALAIAVANTDASGLEGAGNDNVISVGKVTGGGDEGAFRVEVQDVDQSASGGTDPENGDFTILLP
jgi:hypothetical protein